MTLKDSWLFGVWILVAVSSMNCRTEDVGGKLAKGGDVVVRNALVKAFDEEGWFFGVVVEVRELENDVFEEWDGWMDVLVIVFIRGDEEEGIFEGVKLGQCKFVNCSGCGVGGAWGEGSKAEEAKSVAGGVNGSKEGANENSVVCRWGSQEQ